MEFFHGRDEEVDNNNNNNNNNKVINPSSYHQFYNSSPRFTYQHGGSSSSGVNGVVHHQGNKEVVEEGEQHHGEEEVVCIEREHMFDKVVTPSDVGKLNRLVIPKQHAEKYFPLDSTANEKGLLLNFEDRSGKPWRFRYSYWNSSQSYVMTKGWSRFVKEKKLYAGDIVSFQRGAAESVKDRLYIDWRRRADVNHLHHQDHHHLHPSVVPPLPLLHPLRSGAPWGGLVMPPNMMSPRDEMVWQRMNYNHQRTNFNYNYGLVSSPSSTSAPIFYLRSSPPQLGVGLVQQVGGGSATGDASMVFNSVPVVHGKASAKRVRLFGVNLDCPISETTEEYHQFMDETSHSTSPHRIPRSPSESPKGNTSMSLDLDI